jgi:hypothetical protein
LDYNNGDEDVLYVIRAEVGQFEATDSVVGYSQDSNDVNIEAEESPLLGAFTK